MVNFDDPNTWIPAFTEAISPQISRSLAYQLSHTKFQFIEDASDALISTSPRVIDIALDWLSSQEIFFFHGTRLSQEELTSIQLHGLLPLNPIDRAVRLERALSKHQDWLFVKDQLPEVISKLGVGQYVGNRIQQVHATLSRASLFSAFDHYLKHGSEFDKHAAFMLLGKGGEDMLALDGDSYVVTLKINGIEALVASHPIFSIQDMRSRGDLPNLVKHFIHVWAFRQSHPEFNHSTLGIDSGVVFRTAVPPVAIHSIQKVSPIQLHSLFPA